VYFFYYVPVGLDADVKRRPLVTWFIFGICVTLFVLYKYRPIGSWWDFTLLIFQPAYPSIAAAFTHAFLHGGWLHLIGNMVYLVLFGRALEARIGPVRFYAVFVTAAAVGAYLHAVLTALLAPQYLAYGVIGASGATSGLLGAYLVRLSWSRVRVAYWVFMPLQGVNRTGRTYVPAIVAVLFWFALQAALAAAQIGAGGAGVAYGEHLGGFAAGMLLALAMRGSGDSRAERALVRARRHFEKAEWFGAQAEYLEYLALRPGDAEARAELARAHVCAGDKTRARESYAEAIGASMGEGQRDRAERLFDEAARHLPLFVLDRDLQLDIACGMERTLKYRAAVFAYESYLARFPLSPDAAFVLLRLAGIHDRRLDQPEKARSCYRRLVDEYPSDEWAEYARARLAGERVAGATVANK
jgi:membrane associated rhomboid family serine protease